MDTKRGKSCSDNVSFKLPPCLWVQEMYESAESEGSQPHASPQECSDHSPRTCQELLRRSEVGSRAPISTGSSGGRKRRCLLDSLALSSLLMRMRLDVFILLCGTV